MGENDQDNRVKLLACTRAILARGDSKFSIAMLCAEAGVTRDIFRAHFSGKAALLAALMTPEPAAEPAVAAPDAWLERRLRVFERALNTLEARVEAGGRDQSRLIAALEEKLLAQGSCEADAARGPAPQAADVSPEAFAAAVSEVGPEAVPEVGPESVRAAAPQLPPLKPGPAALLSRSEMADVLQAARGRARPVPQEPAPHSNARLRWLAIGALSLVALFLCAGLIMGDTARATAADLAGSATTVRRVAPAGLARTIALADAGDARAQTALAVAYLRGTAIGEDPAAALRWSVAAARDGHPVAQYVLGTLVGQGAGVDADPVRAFDLFARAAAQGNLKAMHNLAIAYAEGLGTEKNEAKAAEWFARAAARGYVDSAFDMGVLHERGMGVAQDLKQALKWYGIAALAGDAPAKARADFLESQVTPVEAQIADAQARAFTPLPALVSANRLPAF